MAFAFITEFPTQGDDRSTTNYDAVNEVLTSEDAPAGLILHYAGWDERAGVFRLVSIWDTHEQGQAYVDDKVMPAVRQVVGPDLGIPPSRDDSYELHNLVQP
jgi:hypothetical protein